MTPPAAPSAPTTTTPSALAARNGHRGTSGASGSSRPRCQVIPPPGREACRYPARDGADLCSQHWEHPDHPRRSIDPTRWCAYQMPQLQVPCQAYARQDLPFCQAHADRGSCLADPPRAAPSLPAEERSARAAIVTTMGHSAGALLVLLLHAAVEREQISWGCLHRRRAGAAPHRRRRAPRGSDERACVPSPEASALPMTVLLPRLARAGAPTGGLSGRACSWARGTAVSADEPAAPEHPRPRAGRRRPTSVAQGRAVNAFVPVAGTPSAANVVLVL